MCYFSDEFTVWSRVHVLLAGLVAPLAFYATVLRGRLHMVISVRALAVPS
jgi:hypothetical protein